HSDDINYEAADDDRQRKTPEGRGGNSPQLGPVEVKILSLHVQDTRPDPKGERGHEQGHTTGDKKLVNGNSGISRHGNRWCFAPSGSTRKYPSGAKPFLM